MFHGRVPFPIRWVSIVAFASSIKTGIPALCNCDSVRSGRSYYSLVAIFALFVSMFALINVGVKPALFSESLALSPLHIAYQSVVNIAPLALALLVFLGILHRILKQ